MIMPIIFIVKTLVHSRHFKFKKCYKKLDFGSGQNIMTILIQSEDVMTPDIKKSIYESSKEEIARHKWIESEKAGRDLGEKAIEDWSKNHWYEYLRARLIEHARGQTFWLEIQNCRFGILNQINISNPLLLDRVLDRVMAGFENLDIILWAHRWGLNVSEVIDILEFIDLNSCRLQYHD